MSERATALAAEMTAEEAAAPPTNGESVEEIAETPAEDAPATPEDGEEAPEPPKEDPKAKRTAAQFAALAEEKRKMREHTRRADAAARRRDAELARREEALKAEEEALTKDPLAFTSKRGLTPRDIAERLMNDGNVPVEKQLEQLKAELRQAKEERQAELKKQADERYHTAVEREAQGFVSMVTASEAYPHLVSEYSDREIAERAISLAKQYGAAYLEEYGEPLPNERIAEYLNSEAEKRAKELEARRSKYRASAKPGNGVGRSQAVSPLSSGTPTLTNDHAAQSSGVPRRKTRDEIRAEIIAGLEAQDRSQR